MDPFDLTWATWWSKIMSFVSQQKGLTGMKVFAVAVALSLTLSAAPSYAQAAAGQTRPAAPAGQGQTRPAAPAGQTPPATTRPAPAQAAPQLPQLPPHGPFPAGIKYGFVQIQYIAAASSEGRAASAKLEEMNKRKTAELQDKDKALQANQQRLDQGGSVLSDSARSQLTLDIDRQQRELQRLTEDAQREFQQLQQQLQDDFQKKLVPVLSKVAQDKGLHMLFSITDSGIAWIDPSLDLTEDVIKELDTQGKK